MSQWKQIHSKPAGALPGNLMTRIGVGAIALLGGVLMLTHSFTNTNRDPAASPDASAQPANQGVQRHLSALIDRETARQEQRLAAEAVDKLQRQAAASANSDELKQAAIIPVLQVAAETLVDSDPGPNEDELKLREALRLEDIERRTRSLRSLPLAQSYRSARVAEEKFSNHALGSAAVQQAEVSKVPSPEESGLRDVVADLSASLNSFKANPNGPPGALPRPALSDPSAATRKQSPADPTHPAKLVQPSDPPGWERIYQGSFLEGVLLTQLSGDFPGPVLAMVSVPFFSQDRQRVLVPRGARAVGTAREVVHSDQQRLAVTFDRLLLPDGRWISLEFRGLNQAGESALKDQVDRHYVSMFAAAGAVGVLSGLTLPGSNPYGGGVQGFRTGAGQGFGLGATQILQRFLNRLPTITIRAGHRLRIWFTSDVLVPKSGPKKGREQP
jgi:type IV secretory pathway VirB10-like protein